jgi:hypothetical protein
MRTASSSFVLVAAALTWSPPARALQPLEDFVRGARAHNPVNDEARAEQAAADARAGETLGRALPAISASGTYTRNEREVALGGATFVPLNQVDGAVALTVPLLDLTRFARVSAANRLADSAAYREQDVARAAEAETVQLYYQLAADLGLVRAARRALEVVQVNLTMTEQTARAGTATVLDVQRASAEVERQRQQLTSAELAVRLVARALAQALTLIPALTGSASERYTNATALLGGHHEAYTLALSLVWAFDLGTPYGIRARNAEAAGAASRSSPATPSSRPGARSTRTSRAADQRAPRKQSAPTPPRSPVLATAPASPPSST